MAMLLNLVKHVFASTKYGGDNLYDKSMGTLHDLSAVDIDGKETSLAKYKGTVALVINVACLCGATKRNYEALVQLYNKYKDQGFEVLAFPCNQFGSQEPWKEAEIKKYVEDNFKANFPIFSKVDVNGDNTHPVYKFLKGCFPGDITWNFAARFLVNQDGIPVARFQKESYDIVEEELLKLLKPEQKCVESSRVKSDDEQAALWVTAFPRKDTMKA